MVLNIRYLVARSYKHSQNLMGLLRLLIIDTLLFFWPLCTYLIRMDEKKEPRMSYKERKAREQLANARDNRKKWENREEESGDKEK